MIDQFGQQCVMGGADKRRSRWELIHNQLPSVDLACLRYVSCNSCSRFNCIEMKTQFIASLSDGFDAWVISKSSITLSTPLIHHCFTEVIVESISHIQSVTRDSFSSRIIFFFLLGNSDLILLQNSPWCFEFVEVYTQKSFIPLLSTFPYASQEACGILRVKFKCTTAPRDFVTIGVLQTIFYLSTVTIQGFLVKHQLPYICFNFC